MGIALNMQIILLSPWQACKRCEIELTITVTKDSLHTSTVGLGVKWSNKTDCRTIQWFKYNNGLLRGGKNVVSFFLIESYNPIP